LNNDLGKLEEDNYQSGNGGSKTPSEPGWGGQSDFFCLQQKKKTRPCPSLLLWGEERTLFSGEKPSGERHGAKKDCNLFQGGEKKKEEGEV